MPDPKPSLQEELLRRATTIGPLHSAKIGPGRGKVKPLPLDTGMENQQPDPFMTLINLLGDPFQNSAPGTSAAVAAMAPKDIWQARDAGKMLIDLLRSGGKLDEVAMGYRPGTGTPIPGDLMKAFEYAQMRYPRLFGHVDDITDVDSMTKLMNFPNQVRGSSATGAAPKFSKLAVDPRAFEKGTTASDYAENVGHELLHNADRIAMPEFDHRYQRENDLPGGYNANIFEIRARNMGDRFRKDFEHYQATGQKKAPFVKEAHESIDVDNPVGWQPSGPINQKENDAFGEVLRKFPEGSYRNVPVGMDIAKWIAMGGIGAGVPLLYFNGVKPAMERQHQLRENPPADINLPSDINLPKAK